MTTLRRITDALGSAFQGKAGLLRVLALAGLAFALIAVVPNPAEACGITDPLSCVAMIFTKIFQLLTALMGWILVLEVEAVIRVSQYFNFVSPGPSAVRLGWIVTRDLANMFFIVILLIIAFGTILGSSTYHYEKNLPRLLIMAVVINFSKTICGLFIDMGQVIMLTFVNGFKEAAAGNFVNAFQINKLLALGNSPGSYTFGMVVAMMFAFILATIAVCVTLVLLVVLLFRVVMLWVLIILSPIAFLSSAIPKGGDYYAQWWKEFKKYIITGPIIAFFLWLALASVQDVGPGGFAGQGFPATYAGQGEGEAAVSGVGNSGGAASAGSGANDSKIVSEAGTADVIMNMVIAICILFAGLKFASESGAAGAGMAKTVRSGLERTGRAIATGGLKMAAQPILTGGGKALARVPLVGGLGRAAVLQGEKWKGERQAFKEKFAGKPEDMARLSPGAFNRSLKRQMITPFKDDVDKKRLSGMIAAGLANPTTAAAMGDGTGASALGTLIGASKGKGLQDAVGTMMTDKNARQWAKDKPAFLGEAYEKIKGEWKDKEGNIKDPNMAKTVSEFEQKFAPQLVENGLMDASRLKELAPKMSGEDVMGLGKGDMGTFMPYLNAGQMRKLAQDGTPDQQGGMLTALDGMDNKTKQEVLSKLGTNDVPTSWYGNQAVANSLLDRTKGDAKARGEMLAKDTGGALAAAAAKRLETAMAGRPVPRSDGSVVQDVDVQEVLASLPDAINVGSLSADKILSDPAIQGYISNNADKIDLAALARNSSAGTREAGMALAASVISADPSRADRMKGEMYQDIRPTPEMMERAGGLEKQAEVNEALASFANALEKAEKELGELEVLATAPGEETAGSQAAVNQLQQAIDNLKRAGQDHERTQKEKASIEVKLAATPKTDAAATAALRKSLGEINKTLEKTQAEIVKGMSALKGGGKA